MAHTQIPMFRPESTWRPPKEYISFRDAKRIAIDVETRDETLDTLGTGVRHGGYIVGIAVAIDDGPSAYYPIRHDDTIDNLDVDQTLDFFDYECRHFKGEVVGAKIGYDLDYLAEELIVFPNASAIKDVQVAEALIDENQYSFSLDNITKKWLGHGKNEDLLRKAAKEYGLDPKKDLWRLPARFVGPYGESDVRDPLLILRKQEAEIEKQGIQKIWHLEQQVTPVLTRMTRYGIRIDEERLEACKVFFQEQEQEAYKHIKAITGHDLRGAINATARLAAVLKERGITIPRTEATDKHPNGQDSVTKDFLETLDDPIAKLLVRARRFNKATGTFYESIKRGMVAGRIHPTFNQTKSDDGGTVTGRLSSSDPNIQQQPVRDEEIGKMWRSIYIPDEKRDWLRCDYKAQEPRLFLHYAAKIKATGAAEMVQKYRVNPDLDPYKILCDSLSKDHVKIIYLGRSYGMGDEKLRRNVAAALRDMGFKGVSHDIDYEVSKILHQFSVSAPYFSELPDKVTAQANKNGFIVTILGRRCRFPNGEFTHKATNRLIQGSAADQTKLAMVELARNGWLPHMQVHDELNFSVHDEGSVTSIRNIMENVVQLEVPCRVDATVGASWGDCK